MCSIVLCVRFFLFVSFVLLSTILETDTRTSVHCTVQWVNIRHMRAHPARTADGMTTFLRRPRSSKTIWFQLPLSMHLGLFAFFFVCAHEWMELIERRRQRQPQQCGYQSRCIWPWNIAYTQLRRVISASSHNYYQCCCSTEIFFFLWATDAACCLLLKPVEWNFGQLDMTRRV